MKYMGNKSRIVNDILPIMLQYNKNNVFVDLFCGSCSVIQNVPIHYKRIANDKNKYLIEMFKVLVSGKEYPKMIPKEVYSKYRNIYNQEKKGLIQLTDEEYAEVGWNGWMGSFNGRFFSGGYSGHNVMQNNGKSRDYISEQIKNTLSQIPYLKRVEFHSDDYRNIENS